MAFFVFLPALFLVEELVQAAVVVGAVAVGANVAANTANAVVETIYDSTHTSTSTVTCVEKKTIHDWLGNGLTNLERDYLLELGYSDRNSSYSLHELKDTAKNRERKLLTQESQTYIQAWIDETGYSSEEERRKNNERVVNCSKKDSPPWKGLKHYRGDIKTNGETGNDRRYYRWDNLHNDIEVYDKNGKHLGSMDPRNGNMYKGPDITNSISHLL